MSSSDTFIQQKLQENPTELEACLQELRKLLEEIPPDERLNLDRNDDEFFKKFIRAERYNIPMALKKIYAYQRFRDVHPELKSLNALKVAKQLEQGFIYILPEYDKKGRSICYVSISGMKFGGKEEGMKWVETFYYISEKIVRDEHSQIDGVLVVCDAKGTGWKNFSHKYLTMVIDMFQGRAPCRVGQFCMLREPSLVRMLWGIASPFLSQRFKARLRFVGENYVDLEDIIDSKILPKEIGGDWETKTIPWLCDLIQSESETVNLYLQSPHPVRFLGATIKFKYKWVMIISVNSQGFAREIGLEPDDMILSMNGISIREEEDLNQIFPFTELSITILRPKPI